MYIYTYTYIYIYIYLYTYIFIYLYIHIYRPIWSFFEMCSYMHVSIVLHICVHVHTAIQTHTHYTHTHTWRTCCIAWSETFFWSLVFLRRSLICFWSASIWSPSSSFSSYCIFFDASACMYVCMSICMYVCTWAPVSGSLALLSLHTAFFSTPVPKLMYSWMHACLFFVYVCVYEFKCVFMRFHAYVLIHV